MKPQDNHNDLIRKLVGRAGMHRAPENFTETVMSRIKTNPAIDDSPLLSTGAWIAIITGLAAMIVVIFTVDIPFFDTMFSSTGIQKVSMNIFSEGFLNTMAAFFKGLNISAVTWMIIAAALGLVVLERLLRKRFSETRIIFL
jgi:hypothetical protein